MFPCSAGFLIVLQAIACVDKKAKLGQLMVSPEDTG